MYLLHASRSQEIVYQLRPKSSASCVSYRHMTNPPPSEQISKQTRSAAKDTTHTDTHTPRLKIRRFRRPRIPETHGIS